MTSTSHTAQSLACTGGAGSEGAGEGSASSDRRQTQEASVTAASNDSASSAKARRVWRITVEGQAEHHAPRASELYRWIGKFTAMHHVRSSAPHADTAGRFEDLEEDLGVGATQCLRFLAEGLSGDVDQLIQPPAVHDRLGEWLRDMAAALRGAGSWELEEVDVTRIDRVFVIIGASRKRVLHRGPTDVMCGLGGNQMVLSRQEVESNGQAAAMLSAAESDAVLVADAVLSARQRCTLRGLAHDSTDSTGAARAIRQVEHVLRLEMGLSNSRSQFEGGQDVVEASEWQLVDWNGLCLGNHPALGREEPAPF